MGSKTPENESQGGGNAPSSSIKPKVSGGEPRGAHWSRDGDGALGDGDGDDDADGDVMPCTVTLSSNSQTAESANSKKKRKKPKKKPKKKSSMLKQTSPPRIPLAELFPEHQYPHGEAQRYDGMVENTVRTTAEEVRYRSRRHIEDDTFLNDYRKAAEVHRQVRNWTQESVRPGQTLTEIAVGIEDGVRALLDNAGLDTGQGLVSGLGFPTGLSLNNCVAHYTPNPGQKDVLLDSSDVMKVDFGVHINGWIVDSAFTMSFDPTYDNLLAAVKDATDTGIQNSGIDVRISDVSAAIQEAMESYEVEINGRTFPVKAVRNITGHNIDQYRIHAGKSVPFVKHDDNTKMEEGEIFAIETFGTTGRGYLFDGPGVYGYGKDPFAPKKIVSHLASARSLYQKINDNFGSLVFCRRYLERLGVERYLAGMNNLVSNGYVELYQPLMDVKGSYSAQFEHTILLRESCKEVISRGDDY
ncbi:Winged helix-turn-helix transcription repressor DNA-binding [Penicillium bovifimosum]|uniref:Methionine aminopeptidase 2 n=1 Tax=Penicillium bovifimosum TaxID=126998 RepID=A0A9W9H999_9EURO|nr:Winged helix-turn-helix transcription repressor DNA-binding [Penicillium bovifimosum]KAJ5142434.1 Winged helix-turn-helix transcription repressor DNA-binding [Penicillium bovifimosum]